MDLDQTVKDGVVFERIETERKREREIENMKKEIDLLRSLNEELKDKNDILKGMLKNVKESENNKHSKGTYAEITAGRTQKPKRIPRITVKKNKERRNPRRN